MDNADTNLTPKQVKDERKNNNPTGKGGFNDNPENIGTGTWDKTMVFSYQYRRFMNMSITELEAWGKTPNDKRTVVEDLAYFRVLAAKKSLPDVREITDRTEGKAPQTVDLTSEGKSLFSNAKLIIEVVDGLEQPEDKSETETST